jgi:hypothetical protein
MMTDPSTPAVGAVRQSRFNRFLAAWLASPFGGLAGRVVLVRYTGRVSGLPRRLPVNAEPYGGGYLIRVGKPEQKTWWRNFRSPWPMELVRKGRRIEGSAVVVSGDNAEGQRIATDYFAHHHGAARRAGLPKMNKGEVPTPEALRAAAAQLVFILMTPNS